MNELQLLKITDLEDKTNVATQLAAIDNLEKEIAYQKEVLEESTKRREKMREELLRVMTKYDVKTFETTNYKITRIDATTRANLDRDNLKKDYPEIYAKYTVHVPVKANVRIVAKKKKEIE